MPIALVVTRGFGNGTLTGSISDVVLAGYGIGEFSAIWTKQPNAVTDYTPQADAVDSFTPIADETATWVKQ